MLLRHLGKMSPGWRAFYSDIKKWANTYLLNIVNSPGQRKQPGKLTGNPLRSSLPKLIITFLFLKTLKLETNCIRIDTAPSLTKKTRS
jgi:hypothetical protein